MSKDEFEQQMKLALGYFWVRVLEYQPSFIAPLIVSGSRRDWSRLRENVLLPCFPDVASTGVAVKDFRPDFFDISGLLTIFARDYWLPFMERDGKNWIAFVPEIRLFLQTREVPLKMYGIRPSLEYYDQELKKVDKLRERIITSRCRQRKRDKLKKSLKNLA